MTAVELGRRIQEIRKAKNMTQHEFAKALGVSAGTVANYETGQNFTINTLNRIAQTLGCDLIIDFTFKKE